MGLMEKPEGPLNWNAAAPELPEMPMVSPGADAMSMTIAGVLPTLAAELTAGVTALSVKENMYSGKLTAAESAYAKTDDQGSQSVGQLTSMIGEVGKMAQQAGGAAGGAGGGSGIFSSLMEQANQSPSQTPVQAPADREPRSETERHQPPPVDGAGAGEGQRGAGPAPITQDPGHRRGDDDLSRRM